MATDPGKNVVGADRISNLPDDLLHRILICLPSTAEAARTGILSRRWRRVWTHLPVLVLGLGYCSPADVDAVLAAWSAPVLHRLEIALPRPGSESYGRAARHVVKAEHLCSWLRFASERVAGELCLSLPWHDENVLLPVRGRFTGISLASAGNSQRLRLRFQGEFTALAALTIKHACIEGCELEELVSSRCPRLKELAMEDVILHLSRDRIYSIRSDSLEKLRVASTGRQLQLQVATPELQELSLCIWEGEVVSAHIAAPKLSKLCWSNFYDPRFYDPRRHQPVEAGRHLKRLELTSRSLGLLDGFDAVDELDLHILLSVDTEGYRRILEETNKIIKCEALVLKFSAVFHAFQPILLHLLRNCVGIKKLVIRLSDLVPHACKFSSCPCKLAHNNRLITNGIVLDSLEEIIVEQGVDANHITKLVGLLCRCSETFQKKVHIIISSKGNKHDRWFTRRKIDRLLVDEPNDKVEVTIR